MHHVTTDAQTCVVLHGLIAIPWLEIAVHFPLDLQITCLWRSLIVYRQSRVGPVDALPISWLAYMDLDTWRHRSYHRFCYFLRSFILIDLSKFMFGNDVCPINNANLFKITVCYPYCSFAVFVILLCIVFVCLLAFNRINK